MIEMRSHFAVTVFLIRIIFWFIIYERRAAAPECHMLHTFSDLPTILSILGVRVCKMHVFMKSAMMWCGAGRSATLSECSADIK